MSTISKQHQHIASTLSSHRSQENSPRSQNRTFKKASKQRESHNNTRITHNVEDEYENEDINQAIGLKM
jgi:hypothetical protein